MAATGRKCAIDIHPQREEIIEKILHGESFRRISSQYGFSENAVVRYVHNVLNKDLAVYLTEQRQEGSLRTIEGCLKELEYMATLTKDLLEDWRKRLVESNGKDPYLRRDVLAAVKTNKENIETIGRFLGMVKDVTIVNNISLESSAFIAQVIDILEDCLSDQPELLEQIEERLHG